MTSDLNHITSTFVGYNTKADPTNLDQRFLVKRSQNVLITNVDKFGVRQGFSLQSLAGTGGVVKGSMEWAKSTNNTFPMRSYYTDPNDLTTGVLEFYYSSAWQTLMSALTSVNLIFDPYWDDTEKIDRLLWCDGTTSLYDWSGAIATLSAITAATVTCQGTSTFGQQQFLATNTRTIRIKDDNGVWRETTYTGGESTTMLTGLATDLTAFPFSGGNLIVQKVITRSNIPDSTFKTDFLRVIGNQVWAGSRSSNRIYVSKNTNITDYSFSTPRAVGEGALLTLDGPGRAVDSLRGDIILFAGTGYIYKTTFNQITVGSSLAETLKVVRLKTTSLQSALHQNLVANIDNGLVWIGYDNIMHKLVDATLAYNPDLRDESDPIKPDFDAADFTGGHLKAYKNRVYISAPASALNFIQEYRLTNSLQKDWFWQPPQTYPVQRYAVISNVIHGHSSATSETYKLFDTYSDNGQAIHAVALLARYSGGVFDRLKQVDELYNEGSISANTTLAVSYLFDNDAGENEIVNRTISGTYAKILYPSASDPSLGNYPEGDISLAGDVTGADTLPRFRVMDAINESEYFDYGVLYETNDIDYRWELSNHGSNSRLAKALPTGIFNNN